MNVLDCRLARPCEGSAQVESPPQGAGLLPEHQHHHQFPLLQVVFPQQGAESQVVCHRNRRLPLGVEWSCCRDNADTVEVTDL
uniref:Uncharacterized protein n=1 Tax=Nothobranchius kuhntae TaxID=321403 RepID=A0A1A8IS40_NOTKU